MIMVRQVIHEIPLNVLLRSPGGGIAKDLLKRGYKVQNRAKILISGAGPKHPKRVDTGFTRSSITVKLVMTPTLAVTIGTGVHRARWIHDGTGIYGPRHQKITAKHGKVLRFKPKGSSFFIYRHSVKGMKPNPFLKDALPAAKT
jgi:hypothetical protein